MKRLFPVILALALSASIGKAELTFGVGPHLGVSFSSFQKPADEFYGTGFLFGAHGDVMILPFLTTRLSLDYSIFSSDKDKLKSDLFLPFFQMQQPGIDPAAISVEGANVSIFSVYVDGKGRIATGGPVTPYGLLGLGLNFVSTSEGTGFNQGQAAATLPSSSSTDFGLNFGAGAEFLLNPVILYMEFKYGLVFTSPSSGGTIPIVVGATFPL